jgi:hypothetical protein
VSRRARYPDDFVQSRQRWFRALVLHQDRKDVIEPLGQLVGDGIGKGVFFLLQKNSTVSGG